MGPRKNNATAAGKDDGAALGKMRRINTAGSNATSSSSNNNKQVNAGGTVTDVGYTNEERTFLESQLAFFRANNSSGVNSNATGVSSAGTDFAAMTKERWMASLPLLISATEKLLRMAADQYQITCKNRAAAAAAQPTGAAANGSGGASPAPGLFGNGHEKDASFAEISRPIPNHCTNNMSITEGVLPAVTANLQAPRPTPAAGTAAQFAEENAYILAQAQQLQWFPFTYQRWVELLLDPGKYHTAKDEGRLRGDAIQASLRRCILVTYPAVEGSDYI